MNKHCEEDAWGRIAVGLWRWRRDTAKVNGRVGCKANAVTAIFYAVFGEEDRANVGIVEADEQRTAPEWNDHCFAER